MGGGGINIFFFFLSFINKKKINCVNVLNKNWKIYDTNFDNIFHALITIFIISTQEGWPNIMFYAEDSNTSDIVNFQKNPRNF